MMTPAMIVPIRASADLRLLRAAVFAVVCVMLAAAGHEMASGDTIPLWSLIAGWGVVIAVIAPLAGRERTLPGIAAAMLGGQIALHTLFTLGQRLTGSTAAGGGSAGSERVMALAGRLLCNEQLLRLTPQSAARIVRQAGIDPTTVAGTAAPMMPTGGHSMAGMSDMSGISGLLCLSLPMLLGHLIAALISGWLLRRGEAALWRIIRLSFACAAALLPLPAALAALRALALVAAVLAERVPARLPRWRADGSGKLHSATLQHSVIRRGPPAAALAV